MERKQKKKENQKRSTCPHSYCDVCTRNHDQGRRHRYFPSHITTFSSLLSRFSTKLSHVRLSLRNPSLLRSDCAVRTRLWCIFCSLDLVETDSLFACGNAITHLASEEHLKNVKDFLWKHGVGADMDRIDTFRVTETELAKWEQCCESLKKASHSPRPEEEPPKDQRGNHNGDASDGVQGNVHSGAPPPWLKPIEQDNLPAPNPNSNKGRSQKLNPKRVGAAWAEKRRAELEREKRGELVEGTSTDNWLPNFGSVWQSGTRKDSIKEFQKENSSTKREVLNMENSEPVLEMKPYVSKRLRVDLGNDK